MPSKTSMRSEWEGTNENEIMDSEVFLVAGIGSCGHVRILTRSQRATLLYRHAGPTASRTAAAELLVSVHDKSQNGRVLRQVGRWNLFLLLIWSV
jgi:hypothetical protein